MASITKRGTSYQVKWRAGGKQHSRTFDSHRAALEHKTDVESQAHRGRPVDPSKGRLTFADWHEQWMGNRLDLRESTKVRAEGLAKVQMFPTFGETPLSKITQQDVQKWVGSLDVAPATVQRAYGEFSLCMTDAVNAGLLLVSPCKGIKLPKRTKKKMVILDHDEIAALAGAIEPRFKALIYLLAYGGLRVSEAFALKPEHIDFSTNTVHVEKTFTQKADGSRVLGDPKTAAGIRTVPVPEPVAKIIKTHMDTYPGEFVFMGERGATLNPRNFGQRNFANAIKKAKLNSATRVHDMRHTAVTMWIRAGVDLPRIASWAGHTNPSFTLSQYAGFFPKDNAAFMVALGEGIMV